MRTITTALALILALSASLVMLGSSTPVYARADCEQTDPYADVVTTQTASSDGTTNLYHVTIVNRGACNVADVAFADAAPAPIISVSTKPAGWTCVVGGNAVSCAPTSTMGVPGTVDFYILTQIPTGDPTNLALATVGGGETACTDGLASTTCDPVPDNNLSSGGIVSATSSYRTLHTPMSGQWTELTVPSGHSLAAEILQLSVECPAGFNNCFGKLVSIRSASTAPDYQTKVFMYPLSVVPSYGSATMKYYDPSTSTWVEAPPCRGKVLPDPCLLSKEKVRVGGVWYVRFTILTKEDDSWIGDS